MSGDWLRAMIDLVLSTATVVRSFGASSSSCQSQPSLSRGRSPGSYRPGRLLTAPRPFCGRSGISSGVGSDTGRILGALDMRTKIEQFGPDLQAQPAMLDGKAGAMRECASDDGGKQNAMGMRRGLWVQAGRLAPIPWFDLVVLYAI